MKAGLMIKVNPAQYPDAVHAVFAAFESQRPFSSEIRIVGGCVRDLVLGIKPKDWDMCTATHPEMVMTVLEQCGYKPFDLSNGHGTVSVIIDGETIEITTLRIDAETNGRHAIVEFVEDFKLDAERRDFTFNAMSADEFGNVYDYFDGVEDLTAKRIRFVGDSYDRITEDYLRILRYFRFAQRFELDGVYEDFKQIQKLAAGLKQVSGERIWVEMQKILTGKNVDRIIKLMDVSGVTEAIGFRIRKDQ